MESQKATQKTSQNPQQDNSECCSNKGKTYSVISIKYNLAEKGKKPHDNNLQMKNFKSIICKFSCRNLHLSSGTAGMAVQSSCGCSFPLWSNFMTACVTDCPEVWPSDRRRSAELDRRGDRAEHWCKLSTGIKRWHHLMRVSIKVTLSLAVFHFWETKKGLSEDSPSNTSITIVKDSWQ